MKEPTIIFMGTSSYAVTVMCKLVEEHFNICAVVTRSSKLRDRKGRAHSPPVKQMADQLNIHVMQPEKIRTKVFYSWLESMKPDLIITAAYGKILSKRHLNIPAFGIVNVHASMLPKLRGAAPVHWAIINGFKETGVTIMQTNQGMDTGPIIAQETLKIDRDETSGSLDEKLAVKGAELLAKSIHPFIAGDIKPKPQQDDLATYAPKISKKDPLIDWTEPAELIERKIRGYNPMPGAYTFIGERRIKIYSAEVYNQEKVPDNPGTILGEIKGKGFIVQAGKETLICKTVQPASKKRMRGDELFYGRILESGDQLFLPKTQ